MRVDPCCHSGCIGLDVFRGIVPFSRVLISMKDLRASNFVHYELDTVFSVAHEEVIAVENILKTIASI